MGVVDVYARQHHSSNLAPAQSQHQVESGLLLNVVVREGASLLQLLPGENQALLVGRNTLLLLDLGLEVFDGIGGFRVQGDGLTSEGLDKQLHLYENIHYPADSFFSVFVSKLDTLLQRLTSQ